MPLRLLLCWLLLIVPAAAQTPLDGLLNLMEQRLGLSLPVAQNKWNLQLPPEDRQREQQLLDRYAPQPGLARDFLLAQIEASKLVQARLQQEWRESRQGPFQPAQDLSALRQQLDSLTRQLLQQLQLCQAQLQDPQALDQLLRQRWGAAEPPAEWRRALAPLWP